MTNANPAARTIELARAAGFDLCGIAPAAEFPELAHLEEWLERGHAGEMRYLQDARRRSPALCDARRAQCDRVRTQLQHGASLFDGFARASELAAQALSAGSPATPGATIIIVSLAKNLKR